MDEGHNSMLDVAMRRKYMASYGRSRASEYWSIFVWRAGDD